MTPYEATLMLKRKRDLDRDFARAFDPAASELVTEDEINSVPGPEFGPTAEDAPPLAEPEPRVVEVPLSPADVQAMEAAKRRAQPAQQSPPVAQTKPTRDADWEEAAEADRQQRLIEGLTLAGRQLVGGITRTPVPEGMRPAPSQLAALIQRRRAEREKLAPVDEEARRLRLAEMEARIKEMSGKPERERVAAEKKAADEARAEVWREKNYAQRERAIAASAGERAAGRAAAGEKDVTEDVQKLGKDLGDTTAFYAQHDAIQRVLGQAEKDIPGVGPLDARLPNFLQSDSGMEMQKAAKQMLQAYGHLITGAGASDAEREQLRQATVDLTNERSFAAGVRSLKQLYDAKVKQIRAKYRPEVVAQYESGLKREGVASMPAPEAKSVLMRDPKTGEVFEVE